MSPKHRFHLARVAALLVLMAVALSLSTSPALAGRPKVPKLKMSEAQGAANETLVDLVKATPPYNGWTVDTYQVNGCQRISRYRIGCAASFTGVEYTGQTTSPPPNPFAYPVIHNHYIRHDCTLTITVHKSRRTREA